MKQKREQVEEDTEDWKDNNFQVIQKVKFIKTRYAIIEDDEQDNDMEQNLETNKIMRTQWEDTQAMD